MLAPEVRLEHVHVTRRRAWGRPLAVLRDVSLVAEAGRVTGLAGANGSGKSTILAVIFGALAPSRGRVTIGGSPPLAYRWSQGIGLVPEEVPRPSGWTVETFLEMGAWQAGIDGRRASAEIARARGRIGATATGPLRALSKGAMRRVAIAYAVVGRPSVLLLDEAESGLDAEGRRLLVELLGELRGEGVSIVMASHDWKALQRASDRTLLVDSGRVLPHRAPNSVPAQGSDGRFEVQSGI